MTLPIAPPSLPEPANPRNPARAWLLAPALLLAGVLLASSTAWFVERAWIARTLREQSAALRSAGWRVELGHRRFDGFPFRLRLQLDGLALTAPSGWSVMASGLEAQAYVHAPTHWVLVAPGGLDIGDGRGGTWRLRGEALSASLAGLDRRPWRVVLQARRSTLTAAGSAGAPALTRAELVEAYLRPAPDAPDAADALLRLEGGVVAPDTAAHRLFGGQPISAAVALRLAPVSAMRGPGWSAAGRAWAAAGGRTDVQLLRVEGGGTTLRGRGGPLMPGPDGRPRGELPIEVGQSPRALAALSGDALSGDALSGDASGAPTNVGSRTVVRLSLSDGWIRLGGFKLVELPRLF